jgi:molecular chaperone DnaJ
MAARDYYEVLGVGRNADDGEVKKAFRRLARELHPDVNAHDPEAETKFKEAAEAYEVLSDPERRRLYDTYGQEGLRTGGYQPPDFEGFGSVSDLFSAFFGGGAFDAAFSGATRRRAGPTQGLNLAVGVTIDLAEAAHGTQVDVTYDLTERCETCKGNGARPGTPIVTCTRCGGAGELQDVQRTRFGQLVRTAVCDACGGDGRIAEEPCETCGGGGSVSRTRTLEVDVPAGIADGQRIRIAGRGHAGERGWPPGDLYVIVKVREDPRFLRDGDDLITVLDVPAPLAALGATLEVPTLDGPVPFEVPPGTQPGETLVMRARGMPALRSGRTGDLRVVVNIATPRRLTREQRDLLQRLADTMTEDNVRSDEGMIAKLRRVLAG